MTHASRLAAQLRDGGLPRQHECLECGTTNDTFVNDTRCYSCGFEWGDA